MYVQSPEGFNELNTKLNLLLTTMQQSVSLNQKLVLQQLERVQTLTEAYGTQPNALSVEAKKRVSGGFIMTSFFATFPASATSVTFIFGYRSFTITPNANTPTFIAVDGLRMRIDHSDTISMTISPSAGAISLACYGDQIGDSLKVG